MPASGLHIPTQAIQGEGDTPSPVSFKGRLRPTFVRQAKDQDGEPRGRLWEVTVIKAGRSLNGLDYPAEVLEDAVPLFEGLPVFAYRWGDDINHASDAAKRGEPRGFAGNRIGEVTRAWWDHEEQAIKAMVAIDDEGARARLLNTLERGGICSGDAEQDAEGFSIDAEGLRSGTKVSRILRGNSLDLVTRPAAGGKFNRLVAEENTEDTMGVKDETKGTQAAKAEAEEPSQLSEEGMMELKAWIAQATEMASKLSADDPNLKQKAGALMALLQRISGGADKEPAPAAKPPMEPAHPEEDIKEEDVDKLAKLMAGVKAMASHAKVKEDEELAKLVASLLAIINGKEEADPKEDKIRALEARLREQAISHAFERSIPESCLSPKAARRLMDLDALEVSEDFARVEGLTEAFTELEKEEPWLFRAKEEAKAKDEKKTETTPAETTPAEAKPDAVKEEAEPKAEPKPQPRGQEVTNLRESVDHTQDGDALVRRFNALVGQVASGDLEAKAEMRKIHQQLQATRL